MSNPLWREARPNSPYGGEPGARPRGRDSRIPGNTPTRGEDPWAGAPTRRLPAPTDGPQPGRMPREGGLRRTGRSPGGAREPQRAAREPLGAARVGWGSLRLGGSLSGGLGVAIVAASTALGASATMLTGKEPGSILGVFVIIGTLAAAVAVRPEAGRVILPVPALAYLVAAMVTGVIYDHSADVSKTALAINAAQWIASGFVAMLLATVLAVAVVTARWILWRRSSPFAPAAWPGMPPANQDLMQPGADGYWTQPVMDDHRTQPVVDDYGTQPVYDEYYGQAGYPNPYGASIPGGRGEQAPPPPAPGGQGPRATGPRPGQQRPPRPEPRQGRPSASGPYNFSSGA
jgi:uncharacterized protein DUF6542